MATKRTVRVLVCRPGKQPAVEMITDTLETWQSLVKSEGQDIGYVQEIPIDRNRISVVCNEDGQRLCPLNRVIPALAPQLPRDVNFVVDTTKGARPAPGTMGVHKLYGTFAVVRAGIAGRGYISLLDSDVAVWTALLQLTQ